MNLRDKTREIGLSVISQYAGDVDTQARFPLEAMNAIKQAKLLGAMIPMSAGVQGASFAQICDVCAMLGEYCSSTAMIYAMHQIQVLCLMDCVENSVWHKNFLQKVANEQLLLASSTSEAGVGGDFRNSVCAIELTGDNFNLTKQAIVISYGMQADAILATARRNLDAPSSDQVIAVIEKHQYTLTRTSNWDTLGMRGVCSEGHVLVANAEMQQIAPIAFGDLAAQTMLGSSHLVWASLWMGIANQAYARARAFVKMEAKKRAGNTQATPAGNRLAATFAMLQTMRARIKEALKQFETARVSPDGLTSLSFSIAMNNLKISTSEMMLEIIQQAMLICGIYGYKNDTPYSLGRLWRDALSAPVMINNDRILSNTANLLLVGKQDMSLVDYE